jgi:hypothetical protein
VDWLQDVAQALNPIRRKVWINYYRFTIAW